MQPEPSPRVTAFAVNTEYQDMLTRRLKAGDESVLREILAAFGPAIEVVLRQDYPQLASDLDDVLSEALFRLWRHRGDYDPKRTPLRPWFFIISRHIALDWLGRNWMIARGMETGMEDTSDVMDDDDEITDELRVGSKEHQDIYEIVSKLSIEDQMILNAHASSEDGESWAADVSRKIEMELGVKMKPGAIRVRLIRLHEKIEKEMIRRGHNLKRFRKRGPRTIPFESISQNREGSLL